MNEIFNLNDFLITENYEYRIDHSAPDKDSGSPLYDVTLNGSYPDDFYSINGEKYYCSDASECAAYYAVTRYYNRRRRPVKIYRAIVTDSFPEDLKEVYQEYIITIEIDKILKNYLKYGKDYIPSSKISLNHHLSKLFKSPNYDDFYYLKEDILSRKDMEQLEKEYKDFKKKERKLLIINPGDWVTISKPYAIEHGKSNAKSFKIVSKTVRADEIYTDGNSILEWGYNPN